MKDMRKVTKKLTNKPVNKPTSNVDFDELEVDDVELDRGCKHNNNKCNNDDHGHEKMHCECECVSDHKKDCEPCQLDAENCVDLSNCGDGCCSPISVQRFSPANSVPFVIDATRVFDTMQFQTFTDALGENGAPLTFDYDVVEVNGPVPRGGAVNVTIDKVCLNYSSITITSPDPTLEAFEVRALSNNQTCDTTFDYAVCLERNATCCSQGQGQSVIFKQKGIVVTVEDLVLELRGHCGCTKIVALACPSTGSTSCKKQVECSGDVQFIFNTLSAPICVPADGRDVILRESYLTNLTVDCIGKALLRYVETDYGEYYYELNIPNDIDLICCLQLTVSTLINDQIVVLGSTNAIQPRVVDTFSKVCDFSTCPGDATESTNNNNNNNNNSCGCNR